MNDMIWLIYIFKLKFYQLCQIWAKEGNGIARKSVKSPLHHSERDVSGWKAIFSN